MVTKLFVLMGLICVLATRAAFSAPAPKFDGLMSCDRDPQVEREVDEAIIDFAKNNNGAILSKLPIWSADGEIVGFFDYFYQDSQKRYEFGGLRFCTEDSRNNFYVDGDAANPKKWLKHTPKGQQPQAWLKKQAALKVAPENDPGLGLINDDETLVSILNIPRGTENGAKVIEVFFSAYDLAEDKTSNQGSFFLRLPKELLK